MSGSIQRLRERRSSLCGISLENYKAYSVLSGMRLNLDSSDQPFPLKHARIPQDVSDFDEG